MPNNTETYWSASGESLHTFAHSIESLGPALRAPVFRGEDIIIPGRPGRVWTPKDVDSRSLPLGMWVRGVEDAKNPGSPNKAKFDENWNNLVRLLWTPGRQFDLTKRFYDTFQGTNALRSATAKASFLTGMEPTMIGRNAGKFIVELMLADPFFYDDTPQTFNLVNGDQTINVRGNAETRWINISINGPRNNTIIRNKTLEHQVQATSDLNSGALMNIDVMNYEAQTMPTGTPNNSFDSSVNVRHTGDSAWLKLRPGSNVINVSSTSGIGSIQLQVKGAWT